MRNSVPEDVNGIWFLKVFNSLRNRRRHLRKSKRRKAILRRRKKIRSKHQIFLRKGRGKTARLRGKRKSGVFLRKKMGIKKGSHTPPYMRPRLRSAYLSLKRNMPLLWTFYDRPETGLPNTNNGIEGLFSDIKSKLRAHRGISKDNRKKLLDEYIMRHY